MSSDKAAAVNWPFATSTSVIKTTTHTYIKAREYVNMQQIAASSIITSKSIFDISYAFNQAQCETDNNKNNNENNKKPTITSYKRSQMTYAD